MWHRRITLFFPFCRLLVEASLLAALKSGGMRQPPRPRPWPRRRWLSNKRWRSESCALHFTCMSAAHCLPKRTPQNISARDSKATLELLIPPVHPGIFWSCTKKKIKKIKTYRGIHRGHIGSCGQCFRKFSRIVNDLSTCCRFHRELLTNVHANTFYLGCKKEVYDVRSGSGTPLGLGTELCTFEGADQTTLDHLWDNLWVILWILPCGCWYKTVVLSSNFPLLGVIYEYY